jgi:Omp85 superfamily domain
MRASPAEPFLGTGRAPRTLPPGSPHRRWIVFSRQRLSRVFVLVIALALAGSRAHAQESPEPIVDPAVDATPSLDPTTVPEEGSNRAPVKRFTPLIAPVPFRNTQIGWGLMVLVGAIHRFDADPSVKPSTGMAGGFYTENKSWGLMAMEMARLSHDTWRLRGVLSHMDVRYDFYGIGEEAGAAGLSIPLEQTMNFGVASVLRRVWPGTYVGAAMMGMQTHVDIRDGGTGAPDVEKELPKTSLVAPGVQGEIDTRDDDYWPRHGSVAKIKTWFFTDNLGGSRNFQRYFAAWSKYSALRDRRIVLATNLTGASAAGDAPFYMLPSVGAGAYSLRGYTQGRYRDKVMITAQAEARYHTEGRVGATVFGGFAQVAPSLGELPKTLVLPAGGLGLRYQLTREFPMHLRLDYAWGRNGNLFYFSIAEAF